MLSSGAEFFYGYYFLSLETVRLSFPSTQELQDAFPSVKSPHETLRQAAPGLVGDVPGWTSHKRTDLGFCDWHPQSSANQG